MEIKNNKDDLEKALSKQSEQPQVSKEEEIGFYKGALNTLISERNELFKMIQNVEAIMQAHIKRLEELGVKIDQGKKE
jgi:uncharacterized protein YqgV (UPF0045/DUF77 family)|tara:strand:+ start:1128 stop:1361 length:234 start_codon:yes stop_codon:yes gene_type:complete